MADYTSIFTTSDEMEEFEDKDATIFVTGYVNCIAAPAPSKKNKEMLFKFMLSNGNRKFWVLVWGNSLIQKYHPQISTNTVVSINGGYCRTISISKYDEEENNMCPFEIIIKENTLVSFLGYHMFKIATANEIQKVSFDNIHTVEGIVEISGFIRTPFALLHNRSGHMTYGLGAITDGFKKITIQIQQFTESSLEVGDYVTVKGTVKGQDVLLTILCESMNDVKLDPEVTPMTQELVNRGGRPVKRVRTKEKLI